MFTGNYLPICFVYFSKYMSPSRFAGVVSITLFHVSFMEYFLYFFHQSLGLKLIDLYLFSDKMLSFLIVTGKKELKNSLLSCGFLYAIKSKSCSNFLKIINWIQVNVNSKPLSCNRRCIKQVTQIDTIAFAGSELHLDTELDWTQLDLQHILLNYTRNLCRLEWRQKFSGYYFL